MFLDGAASFDTELHYFDPPRKKLGKLLCPVWFWQTHSLRLYYKGKNSNLS